MNAPLWSTYNMRHLRCDVYTGPLRMLGRVFELRQSLYDAEKEAASAAAAAAALVFIVMLPAIAAQTYVCMARSTSSCHASAIS